MSGSNVFEHLIIQGSGIPLTDGTKIPTHDPGKAGEFLDVEPCPMRIQLLQITGMVKNACDFPDLTLPETQARIVDPGAALLPMTTIGCEHQGGCVPVVTGSDIGTPATVQTRRF